MCQRGEGGIKKGNEGEAERGGGGGANICDAYTSSPGDVHEVRRRLDRGESPNNVDAMMTGPQIACMYSSMTKILPFLTRDTLRYARHNLLFVDLSLANQPHVHMARLSN